MQARAEFARDYALGIVLVREELELVTPIWFRWQSARLGARINSDRVDLPAESLSNEAVRSAESGPPARTPVVVPEPVRGALLVGSAEGAVPRRVILRRTVATTP